MINDKSDKNEKLAFLELLDQVSMIARSELQEGEQSHLSMQHLEVVMAKTSARHPNASLVIPQQQQERSGVLIQVKTATIITSVSSSSIDVQGQILEIIQQRPMSPNVTQPWYRQPCQFGSLIPRNNRRLLSWKTTISMSQSFQQLSTFPSQSCHLQ